MRSVVRKVRSLAIAIVAAAGVGACASPEVFDSSFWSGSPLLQNDQAELGIAQLAKGNYVAAEGHFQKALKANPKDVDALIGAGILYQNTGQVTKAREMYEAVLAIRPDEAQQFVVWNKLTTRPASQIASVNLSLLETGGGGSPADVLPLPPSAAAGGPGSAPTVAPQQVAAASAVTGAPEPAPLLGRVGSESAAVGQAITGFSGGDANVVSRFSTLRTLRDQGLLTENEFNARRRANVGALLPLTSPPPAAGLDRPVPSTEQISGRLRAIGRALELRAITVSQHSAERSVILDALLPTAPVVVANPAPPPKGLLEAADNVRRLEQLRDGGIISSDEYSRERQAVEQAMQPKQPPPAPAAAASPSGGPQNLAKASASASGPQPAVHLASYRSEQQAQRGWAQIQKTHQAILGGLAPEVSRVNLGRKGVYFRLKAGPVGSNAKAREICGQLKRRRQFCEPSTINAG